MSLRRPASKTKGRAPANKAKIKTLTQKKVKVVQPPVKKEVPVEPAQKRGRPSRSASLIKNAKKAELEVKSEPSPAKISKVVNNKTVTNKTVEKVEDESDDKRRRRRDTKDYINRRFLYDVPEQPKRTRKKGAPHTGGGGANSSNSGTTAGITTTLSGRKSRSRAGSAMALLAASAANLISKKKEQQQKKKRVAEGKAALSRKLDILADDDVNLSSDGEGMLMIDGVDHSNKYRPKINKKKKPKKRLDKRPPVKDRFPRLRDPLSGDDLDVSLSDQSDFFVQSNLITTGGNLSERRISGDGIRCKTSVHRRRDRDDLGSDLGLEIKSRQSVSEDEFACYGAGSDIGDEDDDEDFSGELLSPSVLVHGSSPLEHGYAAGGGGLVSGPTTVSRRKSPIRPMLVLPAEVSNDRNRRPRHYRNPNSPFGSNRRHNYPDHHHHHHHGHHRQQPASGVVLSVSPGVNPDSPDHAGTSPRDHHRQDSVSLSPTSSPPLPAGCVEGGSISEVDDAVRRIMRTEKIKEGNRHFPGRRGSGPPNQSSTTTTVVKPPPRPQPPGPRRRPSILQRKSAIGQQASQAIPSASTTTSTVDTNTTNSINTTPLVTTSVNSVNVTAPGTVVSSIGLQLSSSVSSSAGVGEAMKRSSLTTASTSNPTTVITSGFSQNPVFAQARQRVNVVGGQAQGSMTASAKLFGKKSGYEASADPFAALTGLPTSTQASFEHRPTFLTAGAQVVGTNGVPLVLQKGTAVQYAMVRGTSDGKSYVLVGGQGGGGQQGANRPSIVRTNARSILRTSGSTTGSAGESSSTGGSSLIMVRGHDGVTRMMPTATTTVASSTTVVGSAD